MPRSYSKCEYACPVVRVSTGYKQCTTAPRGARGPAGGSYSSTMGALPRSAPALAAPAPGCASAGRARARARDDVDARNLSRSAKTLRGIYR